MSVSISPVGRKQYLNANGDPAVGSKLFFYAAGSTTKQNTYTTSSGSVANLNPIILDSEGKTPLEVWFTDGLSYKEVLAPSTDTDPPTSGVLIADNLLGSGAFVSTQSEWVAQSLTPTYISSTSFSLVGDQTTAFQVGRRILCVTSAGSLYGFITSSVYTSLTTIIVQLDSGVLDAGLSSVSLGLLSVTNPSIPNVTNVFNAGNPIINGNFNVAQAGASFAAAASTAYDLDGWLNYYVTSAVMTIAQDTASLPAGYSRARKVTFTTADASIAVTDFILQQTKIEGFSAVQLLNNTFTLGFWVRSAVTGVHCVSMNNGTSSYIAEYVINTADTWEFNSITVVGGTPYVSSTTNANGFIVSWVNAVGSNFHGTDKTWNVGVKYGTSAQVNDAATINNTFHLAGVSINLGAAYVKPFYDHKTEVGRCQRYYEAGTYNQTASLNGAHVFGGTAKFCTPKANIPTIVQTSTLNTNCSATTAQANITGESFSSRRTGSASGAAEYTETWTAAARL